MVDVNVTAAPTAEKVDSGEQFLLLVINGVLLFLMSGAFYVAKVAVITGVCSCWCKSAGSAALFIKGLDTAVWACLWFAFSVSLVIYNKWLLFSWEGGFGFPLFVSMWHMLLKMVFSRMFVKCTSLSSQIPDVSPRIWWLSAVPVGVATALDIAASNASYLYVNITFYTIVKSSSLIFTLIFSVLYKLQKCSVPLTSSVLLIAFGVVMSSYGDTEFSWIGFWLLIGAAAIGGFRWALTQVLMKQIECNLDAILTVYLISPASAVTLIPFVLLLEVGPYFGSKFFTDPHLFMLSVLNIIGAGVFSFALIVVELELLQRTSSMSLGVISYLKQIIQVTFSVMVFHDKLTPLNIGGFGVTILGMICYTYIQEHSASRRKGIRSDTDGLFVFDEFEHDELEERYTSDRDRMATSYSQVELSELGSGRSMRRDSSEVASFHEDAGPDAVDKYRQIDLS